METISQQAANLRASWETDQRWAGIARDYTAEDVIRLRGSVVEEHTLARRGASRLWELLRTQDAVRARRHHRQPGGADGEGGAAGHLPVRLAGRR